MPVFLKNHKVAYCIVLEDERIVRNVVTLILRQSHHSVRQAGTPEEAELICNSHPIDVLIADVKLADGRSGTEFALALIRAQPEIKCLFISGLPIEGWNKRDQFNVADMLDSSYAILCKPFSPDVLLMKAIDELLARRGPVGGST